MLGCMALIEFIWQNRQFVLVIYRFCFFFKKSSLSLVTKGILSNNWLFCTNHLLEVTYTCNIISYQSDICVQTHFQFLHLRLLLDPQEGKDKHKGGNGFRTARAPVNGGSAEFDLASSAVINEINLYDNISLKRINKSIRCRSQAWRRKHHVPSS